MVMKLTIGLLLLSSLRSKERAGEDLSQIFGRLSLSVFLPFSHGAYLLARALACVDNRQLSPLPPI